MAAARYEIALYDVGTHYNHRHQAYRFVP
jgi:hypothetical protein